VNRLYDRDFVLSVASQTCFMIAWTLTAHYARWISWLVGDESAAKEIIGNVMGFSMIAGVVTRPWMGQWINRLGARVVWGAGYIVFILAILSNLLLEEADWTIYAVRVSLVLAASLTYGASLTYITQNAPADRQSEAIGTFGLSGFLAMLIGPRIGDVILGTEAASRSRGDFDFLFYCVAGALVPALIVLFFLKPTPAEHRSPSVRLIDFVRTVRRHWPGTIVFVMFIFGAFLGVPFIFLSDLADFLRKEGPEGAEDVQLVGRFFMGYALTAIAIRIGLRRAPEKFGRRKVMLLGLLSVIVGMGSLHWIIIGELHDILFAGICCGAGHGFTFHTMTSLMLERFPVESRGSGSAFSLMTLDFGTVATSPILGWLADRYGYSSLVGSVALLTAIAFVVFTAVSVPIWIDRARNRRARATADGDSVEP